MQQVDHSLTTSCINRTAAAAGFRSELPAHPLGGLLTFKGQSLLLLKGFGLQSDPCSKQRSSALRSCPQPLLPFPICFPGSGPVPGFGASFYCSFGGTRNSVQLPSTRGLPPVKLNICMVLTTCWVRPLNPGLLSLGRSPVPFSDSQCLEPTTWS